MMAGESLANPELKVIIASRSQVPEGKATNFAKKVTKHIRVNRRWSFVNASVEFYATFPVTPSWNPSSDRRPTYRLGRRMIASSFVLVLVVVLVLERLAAPNTT